MAILACEPHVCPANLFQGVGFPGYWSVIHTLPRMEKALARLLNRPGLGFFLPCTQSRTLIRGKIRVAQIPLFSGYLFVKADRDQTAHLLRLRQVASIQSVVDQERLFAELKQVHDLIALGAPLTAVDRLAPGMNVDICQGPMRGLRGRIVNAATGRRFVVSVDFIGKGVSVVLDDVMLARCS